MGTRSLREWGWIKTVKCLNMLKIIVGLHMSFKVKQLNHKISAKVNTVKVYPVMVILMLFCKYQILVKNFFSVLFWWFYLNNTISSFLSAC